jgi:hypothetical protein
LTGVRLPGGFIALIRSDTVFVQKCEKQGADGAVDSFHLSSVLCSTELRFDWVIAVRRSSDGYLVFEKIVTLESQLRSKERADAHRSNNFR